MMIKHNNYLGLRSILLTPIMDDRKWAKIPDMETLSPARCTRSSLRHGGRTA